MKTRQLLRSPVVDCAFQLPSQRRDPEDKTCASRPLLSSPYSKPLPSSLCIVILHSFVRSYHLSVHSESSAACSSFTVAYEIYLSRGTAEINLRSDMVTHIEQEFRFDARRPRFLRQSRSHTCHPTLLRRSQLGNTHGAVVLPCCDDLPAFERPMAQQQPRGRPSIQRRYASEDGCADHDEGASAGGLHIPRLSERVASPVIESNMPDVCKDNILESTPLRTVRRLFDGEQSDLSDSGPHELDPPYASATPESCSVQVQSPGSPTGAAKLQKEQLHGLRRTSSFQAVQKKSARKPLVRFASTQELQGDDDKVTSARGLETVSRLRPPQHRSTFTDPFTRGSIHTSRTESSASDAASYLRPDAFAGHRDTLARIPHRPERHDADIVDSPPESSSSSPEVDLQAFAGHRVTFSQIHFEKRVSPYVPSRVIEKLLSDMSSTDYLNLRLTCRQWCRALPPPRGSAIHRLPREILQLIFAFQEPCDFDAARHTCREWFIASLDFNLLCGMLRTMQCQNA